MWKPLAAAVIALGLLVNSVAASALRIDLTKANQATAPLKYALRTAASSGLVTVSFELPRKQKPLDHLWRIDLVLRDGNKSLITVPIQTTVDGDTLKADLILDPKTMQNVEIWIRTGEHAPLAETIYAINVGSFK